MDLIHLYNNIGEWYHSNGSGIPERMNNKLDQELTKQLYRHAPSVGVSLAALLAVAIYFFWGKFPPYYLLTWTLVNTLWIIALGILAWRYFNTPNASEESKLWINRYGYLALLQDFSWGIIGPLSFMVDNELYRVLTLFMLGGMSAGGIVTRGVVFRAYALSIFGLLAPIIVTLAIQADSLSEGMMFLTIIFLLFMLSVAKSYSLNIKRNILLWVDNEKLVNELKKSKSEVEDANKVLLSEIEQRKRIEEELVDAKEVAERASEAKNQFLANVSHELRTPLNGIIGFTSILDKEKLNDDQQRYIGQIGKSANTLLRIVNDILDITSIEAGHLRLYEEAFSLNTEMGEVLAILRPMAESKGLKLEQSIDETVPDWLHGDPNRLRQIISNLLSNALKYTEEGCVRLQISLLPDNGEKICLHFSVEDTGIGIAEQEMNTLFDNFTRVEGFETRHNEGVGLGLSIVKNLVQLMGGAVHVDSKPGEGSRFSFELPFERGISTPELPSRDKHSAQPVKAMKGLKGLKVLVVDDNDVNRLVLATFLKQNGVGFDEASCGQEALQMIHDHDYDVVLLDIQMPDISGTTVASRVMGMSKDIPTLIAVTAHAFPEQREKIIAAGFSDFLLKPIAEEDLMQILSRINSGQRGGKGGNRIGL